MVSEYQIEVFNKRRKITIYVNESSWCASILHVMGVNIHSDMFECDCHTVTHLNNSLDWLEGKEVNE